MLGGVVERRGSAHTRAQGNTFTSFANSLFSTSRHHSRSMAANSTLRQYRTIAYVVAGVVFIWLLFKVWPSGSAPPPIEDAL